MNFILAGIFPYLENIAISQGFARDTPPDVRFSLHKIFRNLLKVCLNGKSSMKPVYIARNICVLISTLFVTGSLGQTAVPDINLILGNADKQTQVYVETFKNLLAEETKTFDIYDKKGDVKKHKVIVSNFIVYPLGKDSARVAEYRNVISTDGKPQSGTDKRAEDFFSKIVNAASSQKELDAIEAESLRYDEQIWISGLTLFQSFVLRSDFRPYFHFKFEGVKPTPDGNVYTISYRQIKPHPAITVNAGKDAANSQNYDVEIDSSTEMNARVNGTLTIDAETFALVGERRERTIRPAGLDQPIIVAVDTFSYRRSDFGIFTPAEITHLQYRVKLKDRQAIKDISVTFAYSKFSKPDVEVKSGEVKSN